MINVGFIKEFMLDSFFVFSELGGKWKKGN